MGRTDGAETFAKRLLNARVVADAINEELVRLSARQPDLDRRAHLVAIFEAISAQAGDQAVQAAAEARTAGVSWRVLSEALGRSISAVRHRYDASTIDSRRRADNRRRGS